MDEKLEKLAEIEGYEDVSEFLNEVGFESVVPGICTNPNCDYTTSVEPDQDKGHCENCRTKTVQSCLVLAGVI